MVKGYKRVIIIIGILVVLISTSIVIVLSTRTKHYDVTFDDKINIEFKQTYEKGQKIIRPNDPVRNGYRFVGWFDENDQEFNFDITVTKATKIYAKWELISYTITYLDEDGTVLNLGDSYANTYTIESTTISLQSFSSSRIGKTFVGWYENDQKTTQIQNGSYGNKIFKAKFTSNSYNISVEAIGGGTITIIGEDIRQFGEEVTVNVEAYDYWTFDSIIFISLDGSGFIEVEPDEIYAFIMPAGDVSIRATFTTTQETFRVTVINADPDPDPAVTSVGGGLYDVEAGGCIWLISHDMPSDYIFLGWRVDDVFIPSSDRYFGMIIYSNTRIEAVFETGH